jgi:hypothetical protein
VALTVSRWILPLLAAALAPTLWGFLAITAPHPDFTINYVGTAALSAGVNAYDGPVLRGVAASLGLPLGTDDFLLPFGRFVQPPLTSALILPLLPLGVNGAYLMYYAAGVASFVAAMALMVCTCRQRGPAVRSALLFGIAWPIVIALALGQVDGFIALALALSLWAFDRPGHGWQAVAGLPIGFATGLKILPGILIVYFLLRRRPDAVLWAVAGLAVSVLLSAVLFGPRSIVEFAVATVTTASGSPNVLNMSILGAASRWAIGAPALYSSDSFPVPAALKALSSLASLVLVVWALLTLRNRPPAVAFVGLLLTVFLAAPLAWDHYIAWIVPLLIPLLAAFRPARHWQSGAVLLGLGILIFLPIHFVIWDQGLLPPSVAALPFWQAGLIALLCGLVDWPCGFGAGTGRPGRQRTAVGPTAVTEAAHSASPALN